MLVSIRRSNATKRDQYHSTKYLSSNLLFNAAGFASHSQFLRKEKEKKGNNDAIQKKIKKLGLSTALSST